MQPMSNIWNLFTLMFTPRKETIITPPPYIMTLPSIGELDNLNFNIESDVKDILSDEEVNHPKKNRATAEEYKKKLVKEKAVLKKEKEDFRQDMDQEKKRLRVEKEDFQKEKSRGEISKKTAELKNVETRLRNKEVTMNRTI